MLFCFSRKGGVNEEEDEEEELGHTDTYAEYVPYKCKAVSFVFLTFSSFSYPTI